MEGHLDITLIITQYICLLFSLCVHEAAHALVADRCGDNTARFMGRISLNPLAHIDPIGTVVLPLLMMTTGIPGIGWAKPVPVNPRNFRNMRRDNVLVSLAGPASNLLLAVVFTILLRLFFLAMFKSDGLAANAEAFFSIGATMIMTNLVLMLFNLIPVPPLDGSHVLYAMVGSRGQRLMEQIGPWGILILIFFGGRLIAAPLNALSSLVSYFLLHGLG